MLTEKKSLNEYVPESTLTSSLKKYVPLSVHMVYLTQKLNTYPQRRPIDV